jgi:protein O-mannosyl-transferase
MPRNAGKKRPLSTGHKDSGKREAKSSPGSPGKANWLYKPAFHLLLISIIAFLAYSNTFHSPFQWDEADFIVGNPIVRDLAFFKDISRAEGLPVYDGLKSRYIGYLTFALNYRLHGLDVFGYHVVNLAIHLINAILVYFLVVLTLRTPFFRGLGTGGRESGTGNEDSFDSPVTSHQSRITAFIVALLFVSHPVQTEAVTYVFQRLASLVSLFYLLSLVMYVKGRLAVGGKRSEAKAAIEKLEAGGQRSEAKTESETLEVGGEWPEARICKTGSDASNLKPHSSGILASNLKPLTYYGFSLLSAILAMKTKENAFTLPFIIVLYEFLFFSGPLKPRVLRLTPFLLTMLIIPLSIWGGSSTAGEIISQIKDQETLGYAELSGREYLFTQFRVIVTYIRLLVLPVNQNLDYDYPIYRSFFDPPVLLSFLFLAAILSGAVYLVWKTQRAISGQQSAISSAEKKHSTFNIQHSTFHFYRLIAFGILWFFITLSVESSIIPIPMLIDEYRIYLPSVGFFIAVVAGALVLLQRFTVKGIIKSPSPQPSPSRGEGENLIASLTSSVSPPLRGGDKGEGDLRITHHASRVTAFAAVFFVIILALASATYARNILWKDKVTLWEDVVRKSPDSPRGYNNLGIAYYEKGLYDKAIEMYLRCIALKPSFRDAHVNLGVAYAVSGRIDLAIDSFFRAIDIDPGHSISYNNLARAYTQLGMPDKAVENYLISISLYPFNSSSYHGLGTSYVRMGRLDEAIDAYSNFVRLSPGDPEAYRNRGLVYFQKGYTDNARADFQKACSLGSRESCGYLDNGQFR